MPLLSPASIRGRRVRVLRTRVSVVRIREDVESVAESSVVSEPDRTAPFPRPCALVARWTDASGVALEDLMAGARVGLSIPADAILIFKEEG